MGRPFFKHISVWCSLTRMCLGMKVYGRNMYVVTRLLNRRPINWSCAFMLMHEYWRFLPLFFSWILHNISPQRMLCEPEKTLFALILQSKWPMLIYRHHTLPWISIIMITKYNSCLFYYLYIKLDRISEPRMQNISLSLSHTHIGFSMCDL